MTDEQIHQMLQMHRYLIACEMNCWIDKINKDYRAAELQEKVNNEEWTKFALWLRKIRDE
ncbi:MAG: hypothetical protein EB127_21800 [Alphaproteobacteria bacterium]|jgi:hypothetical protein|nr:hypothetical protein [Alphaproteobacteria bacterium]